MLNQKFFIATILLLVLSSQMINASIHGIANQRMGIQKGIRQLQDLILKLAKGRSMLGAKRFLSLSNDENRLDIQPLNDAMKLVNDGVDTFAANFPDFFEAKEMKESLDHVNANWKDFYNTNQVNATLGRNGLGEALLRMDITRTSVLKMLKELTGAITTVEKMYAMWDKASNIKKESRDKIFMMSVANLATAMTKAMVSCENITHSLQEVASSMQDIQTAFMSLGEAFKNALDHPKSPEQENYFGAFIQTSTNCAVPCIGMVFTMFMSSPVCVDCIGANILAAVMIEKARIEKMVKDSEIYLTNFITAMDRLQRLSKVVRETAQNQANSVQDFSSTLGIMETELKNDLEYFADENLREIMLDREQIIVQMTKLRSACIDLNKKFTEVEYPKTN